MTARKDYNDVHWRFAPKKGATRQLVANVTAVECGDIPARVLELAKMGLLDALGCMAAGALQEAGKKVLRYVRNQGGRGEATVVHFGDRVTRYQAALVNGAFCHGWEFDDAMGHGLGCEAVVIPAVLAVGEKELREGNRLLAAIVLGWETICRVAAPVEGWIPSLRRLHPVSTFGPFGAAVAAGKLLGFGEADMENAISLCEAQAAGMSQPLLAGSELGRLNGGFASSYGIRCAYMAKEGLSGARENLEGNMGYYQCVCGLHDDDATPRYDVDKVNAGFGDVWLMENVSFKTLPVGDGQQAVLEALGALRAEKNFAAGDVEEIVVTSSNRQDHWLDAAIGVPAAEDLYGAQRSMAWGVAQSIVVGANDIDAYRENVPANGASAGIAALAGRVRFVFDAGIADAGNPSSRRVAVRLKSGAQLEARTGRPKGSHLHNPMNWSELEEKFRAQAAMARVPSGHAGRVIDMVRNLENVDDAGELTQYLRSEK